jgi:hypothetical protein
MSKVKSHLLIVKIMLLEITGYFDQMHVLLRIWSLICHFFKLTLLSFKNVRSNVTQSLSLSFIRFTPEVGVVQETFCNGQIFLSSNIE